MPDSLPSLAGLDDLHDRLPGGIDTDDEPRAQAALDDASAEVRHAASRTWVDESGELADVPPIARRIALRIAKDLFENPYGYKSEQIGEYANQRFSGGMLSELERHQLDELSGDLVSVEMQLPYTVSGKTARILDEYRKDEARWL